MQKLLSLFALLLLSAGVATANDQELYDPAPPADSAFIRLINASNDTDPVTSSIGSVTFTSVASPSITDYSVLKAGDYEMKIGENSFDIHVEAGKYYTLALLTKEGKPSVTALEDAMVTNPAKAVVYFYNLSNAPKASLFAPQHKADIVAEIESGQGGAREVNALTLDLAITAGGKEVKAFPGVELKRRTGVTFLLSGSGENLTGTMQANNVKR